MRDRSPLAFCAACITLSGCLIAPPAILQEAPPPPRATVVGTLWPPPDEPTFVVADRQITIERAGEPVAEERTDRRGRFEVRLEKTGRYSLTFSANAHRAAADLSVFDVYTTYRVELVAHRR